MGNLCCSSKKNKSGHLTIAPDKKKTMTKKDEAGWGGKKQKRKEQNLAVAIDFVKAENVIL